MTQPNTADQPSAEHSHDVARIGAAMAPYLAIGDQRLSGAEWSVPVNTTVWARHLTGFPSVTLAVENGRISRTTLLDLAEQARTDPTQPDTVLSLFWNVLAWGVAGNFRNIGRIARAVTANTDTITGSLVDAAEASYAGDPQAGFRLLARRIPQWGPAFFTKYLHFTTGTTNAAKAQCLILDDRVRVAWRCFAGKWLNLHSSADYLCYCGVAGEIARGRGCEPAWLEGRLYQFGRQVGTYERFADTQLALCRQRLATDFPTTGDTWQALTTDSG